jgi:PadR family transcriptional regulator, regulatory protein PadR
MGNKAPRLSYQTLLVLQMMHEEPCGAEISKATGLASGVVYPILARLESAGWIAGRSEEGDPSLLKRPLRKFYRLTRLGRVRTRAALGALAGTITRARTER